MINQLDENVPAVASSQNKTKGIIAIGAVAVVGIAALAFGEKSEYVTKDRADEPYYTEEFSKPIKPTVIRHFQKKQLHNQVRNANKATTHSFAQNSSDNSPKKNNEVMSDYQINRGKSSLVVYHNKLATKKNIQVARLSNLNGGLTTEQMVMKQLLGAGQKDSNIKFMENNSRSGFKVTHAVKLLNREWTVLQGTSISAVLETPIVSKLPGNVRAVVDHDVYSSKGRKILIPKGSSLFGTYNSQVRQGQNRVFVIWTRLITPNGVSIMVNSKGADQIGLTGLKGSTNNHFFKRFGNSIMLSLIGAGASNGGVSSNDSYNSKSSYRDAVSKSLGNASNQSLSRNAGVTPTISIPQGGRVTVMVERDLSFYRVRASYE